MKLQQGCGAYPGRKQKKIRPCHPSIICVRVTEGAEKLRERGRPEVFHKKKTRKSSNKTIKLCKIKLAKELKECSFCSIL